MAMAACCLAMRIFGREKCVWVTESEHGPFSILIEFVYNNYYITSVTNYKLPINQS